MTTTSNVIRKVAVDEVAAEYWRSLYKDSGYGELWVREIPNRITAALNKQAKTAATTTKTSSQPRYDISPIATVVDENGVSLEGIAAIVGNPKAKFAFCIDFDHKGAVKDFVSMPVPVQE